MLKILTYLSERPAARDTARGVLSYWLPPGDEATLPEVERALDALVEVGWLDRRAEGHDASYGTVATALPEILLHVHGGGRIDG